MKNMKKLLMEFIGTFFFILTIAMTGNPFAIAAMLMAWVYIGGYVSGGHYNPAVSLAVAARGKLAWHELPWYWLAQIAGGIAAYTMTSYFHHAASLPLRISIPMPGVGVTLTQAFIMEIFLAFVLCLVVLVVATAERLKLGNIFGLAIGFTIPALAYLGGPISGGLFNPAIALGANIVAALQGRGISWEHLFMYVVGALLGGLLAACAYKYFLKDDNENIIIFKVINW